MESSKESKKSFEETYTEAQVAIARMRYLPPDASEEMRMDLTEDTCLALRSAYFAVFIIGTMDNVIPETVRIAVDHLFSAAFAIIPEGKYKDAATRYFEDFQCICNENKPKEEEDIASEPIFDSWEFSKDDVLSLTD
jgi:hypothetical protein